MPSKNPKHNKKAFYERKQQYAKQNIPVKYIAMGVIFVLSITGVVLLAIFLPDSPILEDKIYIEDGDTAELHYKLWKFDDMNDLDTSETPFQESTNFITEVSKGSLINGFYYELIDKREIDEIFNFAIDIETDANSDGFDDDTGDEILGYADGQIYYFWVRVINITKSEENTPASSNFAVQVDKISENSLYCSVRKLFAFEFLENY